MQERGGDTLPIDAAFTGAGAQLAGTFDSDALQVAGIPFSNVRLSGTAAHFELAGDSSTVAFDGALAGDAITGTFTDGANRGTFQLHRAKVARPAVHARDVTFADGAVTLAGTVIAPAAAGTHAAIVFMHGSGPEGRWANRYLAQKLAEHGIVALIYDKRGVGASTGDWRGAGFEPLADDAAAGVRFVRSLPEVDPRRVGIYGHSQGATLAPLVATKLGDLAFVIASAPGGLAPADVEIYSIENSIGVAALPAAERADAKAYVRAVVDVAYRGAPRAGLDALATRFAKRSWFFPAPADGDPYWAMSRQIAAFDPARAWRGVKAPVLLAYGAFDERVPRAGIDAIAAALHAGGNTRVTLHVWPHADHTFTIVDPPKHDGWPAHAPDYATALADWVTTQAR